MDEDQKVSPPPKQTMEDIQQIICAIRTSHQTQSRLIVLADQKANALIGVLVVAFTILFSKIQQPPDLSLISQIAFIAFLLLALTGIIFALMVIFPKNIAGKKSETLEQIPNPLFFGVFTQFEQEEYVDYLTDQLATGASAMKLFMTDYYQVGMVLKQKYSQLRWAYMLTICGFAVLLIGLAINFIISI